MAKSKPSASSIVVPSVFYALLVCFSQADKKWFIVKRKSRRLIATNFKRRNRRSINIP